MKGICSSLATFAMLFCIHSNVSAAELLDVKPVEAENAVSVEISADIPMTFTYYNIPGQPRAVVDIADADPEKVEPLIVVNKGIISSISVDKAQIAGMVVSRVIFNLVSESKIAVTANADRKKLTVTFAAAEKLAAATKQVETKPAPETPHPAEQEMNAAVATVAPQTTGTVIKNEDQLDLDEKKPAQVTATTSVVEEIPNATGLAALPTSNNTKKIEPVIAPTPQASTLFIKKIISGDDYIEIKATGEIGSYKTIKLTQPERIAIDIPGAKNSLGANSVSINKSGITKARIGANPGFIRIVLDSTKADFPKHTITNIKDGLRIDFK